MLVVIDIVDSAWVVSPCVYIVHNYWDFVQCTELYFCVRGSCYINIIIINGRFIHSQIKQRETLQRAREWSNRKPYNVVPNRATGNLTTYSRMKQQETLHRTPRIEQQETLQRAPEWSNMKPYILLPESSNRKPYNVLPNEASGNLTTYSPNRATGNVTTYSRMKHQETLQRTPRIEQQETLQRTPEWSNRKPYNVLPESSNCKPYNVLPNRATGHLETY